MNNAKVRSVDRKVGAFLFFECCAAFFRKKEENFLIISTLPIDKVVKRV